MTRARKERCEAAQREERGRAGSGIRVSHPVASCCPGEVCEVRGSPGCTVWFQKDHWPMLYVGAQKCRYTRAGRLGNCSSFRKMISRERLRAGTCGDLSNCSLCICSTLGQCTVTCITSGLQTHPSMWNQLTSGWRIHSEREGSELRTCTTQRSARRAQVCSDSALRGCANAHR